MWAGRACTLPALKAHPGARAGRLIGFKAPKGFDRRRGHEGEPGTMKKILVVFFLLAAAGVAAFFFLRTENGVQAYRTEKVSRGELVATVTATGTVNAVTTVLVGTQVSGTIKEIYADFNSPVRNGQVIAQIDPRIFQANVESAKANLLVARANLEKSKATLKDAERTLGRNKELYRRNLIAKSDLDAAQTAHDTAAAQVNASAAQVSQTEATLKLSETNLAYTKIVSPVDGIVVSRNVDVGQTVAASFQTPTLFTIAEDLTKMQVNCSVAEADIGRIKDGLPVEFTVDAYPDKTFKGKVSETRIAPIIVQNVVTYDVVVMVANPELMLKPGMTANVSIIYAQRNGVLRIPNAALRFYPEGSSRKALSGPGVWVPGKEEPRRVKVTTGISDGSLTEVVSGDLKEGQEVIVESLSKPKNRPQSNRRLF